MIYDFADYKRFLHVEIARLPKKGRGQARKLAEHLGAHPVVVSQVLSGARDFSAEQAYDVATYFGLDDRATEYFTTLVAKARAGNKRLVAHLEKKLSRLRAEALAMENRLQKHQRLSDEAISVFYSNWYYSGVRLLTSVPGFDNVDSIAAHFRLSRAKVTAILAYLVQHGLCVRDDKGRYSMGTVSTIVGGDSPFVDGHHRNWRAKAAESLTQHRETDCFYTLPCSLSAADKKKLRLELADLVTRFSKCVQDSPAEQVSCLNIDWFDA